MSTASVLIEGALRAIGALNRGITLSSEDAADGLEALDLMIKGWGANQLAIPYRTRESLTLTSGTNPHTIGSSGTLNTTRPLAIHTAAIRVSSTDYPLDIWQTVQEYWRIPNKTSTGQPRALYYEPVEPLGRIYFDLVPDSTYTFLLDSLKPLTSFSSLSTDDSVPDEYLEPIKFNLALRLAPEYGKTPSNIVIGLAAEGMNNIERMNAAFRVPVLRCDEALLRRGGNRTDINYLENT
ncbi:MAG: hypothetical protein ABT940_13115 [Alphaproteobacteria bacterium]